ADDFIGVICLVGGFVVAAIVRRGQHDFVPEFSGGARQFGGIGTDAPDEGRELAGERQYLHAPNPSQKRFSRGNGARTSTIPDTQSRRRRRGERLGKVAAFAISAPKM